MRKLMGFLVLTVALLGLAVPGFAAETDSSIQDNVGGALVYTDALGGITASGSGGLMTGVAFAASGTACNIAIYDSDSINGLTNAKCKFEDAAAANTGKFVNLKDSPIRFKSGIVVVTDTNDLATLVYTQQVQ